MAKRISSGEKKPRRTSTTRRRSTKAAAAEAAPAAQTEAAASASETKPAEPGPGLPASLAAEASPSGLMTGGQEPLAAAGTNQGTLAQKVAQATTSSPGVWGNEPDREAIARRAFELFLARGGVHGHDVEDWLAAERELRRR
jgi:hypothetical protein